MAKDPISTEAQQHAIDFIIHSIREGCVPLFEKLEQLKRLDQDESIDAAITVIKLRLDTLAKVELKLLAPLKEEYVRLENLLVQPGEGFAMHAARQNAFIESLLQGL
jgi:hypothetical protein